MQCQVTFLQTLETLSSTGLGGLTALHKLFQLLDGESEG